MKGWIIKSRQHINKELDHVISVKKGGTSDLDNLKFTSKTNNRRKGEAMDYKTSGVDIKAGNEFVERLKLKVPTIGGFGGMFKVPRGYEEPILISGADGVGTKICICSRLRDYTTIGIDLVAMCVNDVITCGAETIILLDYISLNTINPVVDDIMTGIIKGCELADIELIGGETAEHPMTFDIDLAGFCTGIVEQSDVVDGGDIHAGDLIIGIESSGIHSNGYSMINHLDREGRLRITDDFLTPTHIYTSVVKELLNEGSYRHGKHNWWWYPRKFT